MNGRNQQQGRGGNNRGGQRQSQGRQQEKKNIVKVAEILQSQKFDGTYVKVNDYYGDLIFRDKNTGKFFKVKQMSIREPFNTAPDYVLNVLLVDLDSEFQAEFMGQDDSEGAAEEQQTEEEQTEEEVPY